MARHSLSVWILFFLHLQIKCHLQLLRFFRIRYIWRNVYSWFKKCRYQYCHFNLFWPQLVHFLDLFSLHNSTHQRFESELEIGTNFTGERIALQGDYSLWEFLKKLYVLMRIIMSLWIVYHTIGSHPSRKVFFITDYNTKDRDFHHSTRFSWEQDSEMGYDITLRNKTEVCILFTQTSPFLEAILDWIYF